MARALRAILRAILPRPFAAIARRHGFTLDPAQQRALHSLQRLYDDLDTLRTPAVAAALRRGRRAVPRHLPVGRRRARQELPDGRVLSARSGRAQAARPFPSLHAGDPSQPARSAGPGGSAASVIAARIARETRLLCLDEFHVTDIGDAMLMRGLLEGLLERRRGAGDHLQPASRRALRSTVCSARSSCPAIELIKAHLELVRARRRQRTTGCER